MLNKIKGHNELNETAAVDSNRPLGSTCLKPEAFIDSKHEERSIYTKQTQFPGWYRPKGLGFLRESISIGSLYSKIVSVF
ncbi:hypothetical protein ACFVS2_26245 [Brevibacillus sp. NPDC058079]|uniref:hypothetical protein n=1 Tax=Brevibacillus sp. NPDC058079 TaxID=3346330 RepID=UPI0036E5CB4A